MLSLLARLMIRKDMRKADYRTEHEHKKIRRFFVRIPGAEAHGRYDELGPSETRDAHGWGETEEEAFKNAREMYARQEAQLKRVLPLLQQRLPLRKRTPPASAEAAA